MKKAAGTSNKTPPQFSYQCFWDMNTDAMDYEDGRNWIIKRVVTYGSSDDNLKMFEYYGAEAVKEEVVKIKYLDKKTLNYLSIIFGIPKEKFRAYHNEAKTWI